MAIMRQITVDVDSVDWDASKDIKSALPQKFTFVVKLDDDTSDEQSGIEDAISDMLSDETGYCHYGFTYNLAQS